MDVAAGLPVFVLAYEAVEDIQRIEKEMGVYLLLELQVPVLRLVGLFPFLEHGLPGREGEVYYVDYAVDTSCARMLTVRSRMNSFQVKVLLNPNGSPYPARSAVTTDTVRTKAVNRMVFQYMLFFGPCLRMNLM